MSDRLPARPSGYDKYVSYETSSVAVALFVLLLVIPMPPSMRDVAVEYSAGEEVVLEFYARELFGRAYGDVEQWQAVTAQILEKNMRRGALARRTALAQELRQVRTGRCHDARHGRFDAAA